MTDRPPNMDRRFPTRRPPSWPAAPRRRGRTARAPAAGAAARPSPAAEDERLSPLPGLRATLNAFCFFFSPDSGDSSRRP